MRRWADGVERRGKRGGEQIEGKTTKRGKKNEQEKNKTREEMERGQ